MNRFYTMGKIKENITSQLMATLKKNAVDH